MFSAKGKSSKQPIATLLTRLRSLLPCFVSCVAWCVGMALLTVCVQEQGFFWDTIVLASSQAQWFYKQGFTPLPSAIDVGHPPLLPVYLAIVWHLAGKSLATSHQAMLPFLIGIVVCIHLLAFLLISEACASTSLRRQAWYSTLCASLVLVQPTFLAQATLVSPDVVLVCCFLVGMVVLILRLPQERGGTIPCASVTSDATPDLSSGFHLFTHLVYHLVYACVLIPLTLVSLRGGICGVMLLCAEALCIVLVGRAQSMTSLLAMLGKRLTAYVPAFLVFLCWSSWHRSTTGGVGFQAWSWSFMLSTIINDPDILKKYAVYGWRLLDFGMIFVWTSLAIGAVLLMRVMTRRQRSIYQYTRIVLVALVVAVMAIAWIPILAVMPLNSIGHRYFLPLTMTATLLAGVVLCAAQHSCRRSYAYCMRLLYGLSVFGLLTGHWWVWLYPATTAKGWDSTLAYLPYNSLRRTVMQSIQQRGIHLSSVASRNHALAAQSDIDLLDTPTVPFVEQSLEEAQYVFYATVLNGFTNEELQRLQSWECIERASSCGIVVEVRKKPR
jgi:hypothetical protein